ncbi:transposase [Streptomyces mirabilis]|uniref:transposase n=1 Tax=Streptomyces mirabilis TaxID=68239 RepID=UPI0036D8E3B7
MILSFPGLGVQLGARVLAEIGDDHTRFADARSLKAYAGSSPVTRASGKKSSITPPTGEERPAQPRRLPVGLRCPDRLAGRQGPLPATA